MDNLPPVENPYAPTLSTSLETVGVPSEAETLRRQFLSHEASIKSMGVLYLLGGSIGILICIGYAAGAVAVLLSDDPQAALGGVFLGVLAIVIGAISVFQFLVGSGLRKFTPWCRIGGIVLSAIGLIGFPIGTLISVYFLYLLVSKKGEYVFSPEYQAVIAATPHVKYKTSIIVWIFLILLILLILLGIGVALVGMMS